jgi:hypothetical protein
MTGCGTDPCASVVAGAYTHNNVAIGPLIVYHLNLLCQSVATIQVRVYSSVVMMPSGDLAFRQSKCCQSLTST